MDNTNNSNGSYNLMYGINDNPKLTEKIILGFQNIFAAFGGIIAVPLVVSGALGFDGATSTALLSASILASGIATVLQAKGVGRVGSKLPCVMGTDFTFVAPSIAVGSVAGLPGIIGATILGSLLEFILSFFIRPIMKFFPPLVIGTVVCLIGLTLLPVSMDWAAGGVGSSDYGSLRNVSIALFVMIITLLINRYGKGLVSSAAILIGMGIGYVLCIGLGMVDFTLVKESSFFAIPKILEYGVNFNPAYALAFIPAYFVTTVETVGCLSTICEVSKVDSSKDRLSRGVLADGVGSMAAGLVGSFPNTTFSQNVGLIPLTRNASRSVATMAGILLILLGFSPKFAAFINIMPQPVLGGVGIVMFGTIAAAGIKTLSKVNINNRNLLIIATSLGLGLGVTFRPELISGLPEGLKMVFSSGITTGTITALLLNIILKEESVKEEESEIVKVEEEVLKEKSKSLDINEREVTA
ncbi:uracil-xanthine permease family protein [Clostridium chrysemydis]|uniref:uracil-xanthine permease family protein n=1 Tax=Clostridium chrysemydis TaxID=2665504 RepID=UPI00188466F9|nr:nucleobase:cation symporter-2 family protein [Clostridium chrysemydis]